MATGTTDLRKSYDGLAAIVEGRFEKCVAEGDLFVFINRKGNQMRVLYWEHGGFCIWMKRLEEGTFRRVRDEKHDHVEIDVAKLTLLIEGVDVQGLTRRKRFERTPRAQISEETSLISDVSSGTVAL